MGTAVGDALGAALEGSRVMNLEIRDVAEGRTELRYTDDTAMMIGVAESLIECRGFNGEHMARIFIRNYEREPFRGYGPGPPRVFSLIKGGVPWDKASLKLYRGGSYGNGSAMRVAPVGLFYYDDKDKLRDVAYSSSQITHSHEFGKEGAALQAYAVGLATNLDPASRFDPEEFLARLKGFVRHRVYKEKLRIAEGLLGEGDRHQVVLELGNSIEAFNSVPTAVFSFLTHPNSFGEAVMYAISLGGDTDTIGAMTGSISGAYHGVGSIPIEWMEKVENRSHIMGLGEKLWLIKRGEEGGDR
ncbi:MAG: ADP-ribosylglycohydrolase family protein [Candidatus Bathyarchaeia archaeon]